MKLEKFIELSNEVQTVDALYRLLEDALEDICGYDRVIFSLMTDHPSLGLSAGYGVMRNYPEDRLKDYAENRYVYIDPVIRFGLHKVGPFRWDGLPFAVEPAPSQEQFMNECRAAGFYDGAAICLRGLSGELGAIGVASSTQKKPGSEKEAKLKLSLMNAIAQQFYSVFCALYERKNDPCEQIVLTEREIEVLRHIALAQKDGSIACDLNITTHAVDFHVRNILRKLNAPNRMFAVLKALSTGLLSLDSAVFVRKSVPQG